MPEERLRPVGAKGPGDDLVARLQYRWPAPIALENETGSDYYRLAEQLAPAFPSLAGRDLSPLTAFTRLLAGSVLLQDRIVDGALGGGALGLAALRVTAMQTEAARLASALFPANERFWDRLVEYQAELAGAFVEEQRFVCGERALAELDEALWRRIAVGKSGLSRIVVAALAELAADDAPFRPLVDALNHLSVATQLADDLEDWKEDLRRGAPSLVLARVRAERGAPTSALAREIHYRGHARDLIAMALAELERAAERCRAWPQLPFLRMIQSLQRRQRALFDDLERLTRANLQRHAQRAPAIVVPESNEVYLSTALHAVRFLVEQKRLGFGEARDLVRHPAAMGVSDGETCFFGDVFQRALFAEVLGEANRWLSGCLAPLLDEEVAYLLSRRRANGGFAYFPELAPLPPDADDLGQVIAALVCTGHRDQVAAHCEDSWTVLLRDLLHADGSFETWIVPARPRDELERRQAALVEAVWGAGADCDVIPNLLYALVRFDPARFADLARRGADYLDARQCADGTWMGRWYEGPYYSIQAGLRFFAAVAPQAGCVGRALSFLRQRQRADGGWAVGEEESDCLSTALALAGLAVGDAPADAERAARGRAFLEARRQDGGWPSRLLVRHGSLQSHGSRSLTTAFVLRAMLAWHARERR